MAMHILEIPSFFTPYGGEFCLEQAKALKALGNEVRMLCNVQLGMTIGGKDFWVLPSNRFTHEREGITIYQTYQRGLPRLVRCNAKRWLSIVQQLFADYVKRYGKPDVLHAHCAKWAGYAAMLIGKDYGIPYVITEHLSRLVLERELGPAPSKAWQIPLLKEAYQQASCVIPVAAELVEDIACYFGKDYRWQAVSNVIDTDFWVYRERDFRAARPFRFCCLANYWPLKGYDVLLPAFKQLYDSHYDVELHIAGRGTNSEALRRQMSAGMYTHGLLSKHEVRDLLYQCDALVLPSRSEAQPLVLLEAMATGIPVVTTDCVPQQVRIEGGCLIAPVGDSDALADTMRQVIVEDYDGLEISQAVERLASPAVIGAKLTEIMQKIIA